MKTFLRALLSVLTVSSLLLITNLAFSRASVISVYFMSIANCDGGGGWYVTVTDDEGVSSTFLFCDGGAH
jgi:hypothetical protein